MSDPPKVTGIPPTPEYVFREYAPRIYHIARRLLNNDADAEDVTQEVLLQVVRKLHTFRGESTLPTWLHRIAVNSALAHREKRAIREKHETTTGDDDTLETIAADPPQSVKLPRPHMHASPDELVLATEQRAIIDRAIAKLPHLFRDVFVLADVEGIPNEEIATLLGLSVSAVKSRLHRARLRMRDLLSPHFEEASS